MLGTLIEMQQGSFLFACSIMVLTALLYAVWCGASVFKIN